MLITVQAFLMGRSLLYRHHGGMLRTVSFARHSGMGGKVSLLTRPTREKSLMWTFSRPTCQAPDMIKPNLKNSLAQSKLRATVRFAEESDWNAYVLSVDDLHVWFDWVTCAYWYWAEPSRQCITNNCRITDCMWLKPNLKKCLAQSKLRVTVMFAKESDWNAYYVLTTCMCDLIESHARIDTPVEPSRADSA